MTLSFPSLFLIFLTAISFGATTVSALGNSQRAKELKDFIQKEKPHFEKREGERKDALGALDRLNADQNSVREKIAALTLNQQEMSLALENLGLEYDKQKQLERSHRQQLLVLLKVAHKIKRDGLLRFILFGNDLTQMATRVRVLYRTLRSHSILTKQLAERAHRLVESEQRFAQTKQEFETLIDTHRSQEALLESLLTKKTKLIKSLNQKQTFYQLALKEYKRVSVRVNNLILHLDSFKEAESVYLPPKSSLVVPVAGRVLQGYGRSIHQRFGTITYHKGLEIEAEHNASVASVLKGKVEYAGWLRGLGNVVIVHHGGALYSLYGHLFQISKEVGMDVQSGENIGTVGDTGSSNKASLYFELRSQGKALDPVAYFANEEVSKLN